MSAGPAPRRVLLVLHGPPDARTGGTGVVVGALRDGLRALGVDARVLAPWGAPLGRRVPALGLRERWEGRLALPVLRAGLGRFDPELIHVHHHSGLPMDLGRLAPGAPVVWTFHDHHLACDRGQLVDRWQRPCPGPAGPACARCMAPLVGGRRRLRVAAYGERLALARRVARTAAARLAPSHHLAQRMAALGFGPVSPCTLPLVHRPPLAPPPGTGPLRVLFLGAVIPTKGVLPLLQAAARGEGLQLSLVGPRPGWPVDPGWQARVERAAAAAGPGRVVLRGPVPGDAVGALLGAHDLLVLPSIWHENSPLTVREATAAGLRTLLPAVGGARELDPAARLVAGGDVAALAAALAAEVAQGRGRRPPISWPTPLAHARQMIDAVYRPALARAGSSREAAASGPGGKGR